MLKRNFCILVNPHANDGRATRIMPTVIDTLQNLGATFRCIISQDIAHAQATAEEAIKQGECLVAVGGDGTLRAIVEVVQRLQGTLAIIPAGRGNDFAKMLRIPTDPIGACQLLIDGKEKRVDIGSVNEQFFLTICTVGFDSVANEIANQTKWIRSRLVYVYGALKALIHWQPVTFHLEIDGKPLEHIGYTVSVANTRNYGGGLNLAPDASLQDGIFDIVLVGAITKFRILMNIPKVFFGKHVNEPGFTILRGKNIRIDTDQKYGIYADGDFICKPPGMISIVPAALRVIADT